MRTVKDKAVMQAVNSLEAGMTRQETEAYMGVWVLYHLEAGEARLARFTKCSCHPFFNN